MRWGFVALDQIANPGANKTLTMSNKTLTFDFTAPPGGDGAFEVQATGGFSGDLMHVHQHTGNPGAGTDLLHLESTDADVLPVRITGGGTRSIFADDPIEVTQTTGTAPFVVASTTEVANLRAATASALAADPSACASGAYATDSAANGNLTCTTPTYTLTFTGATAVCNADPPLFKSRDLLC